MYQLDIVLRAWTFLIFGLSHSHSFESNDTAQYCNVSKYYVDEMSRGHHNMMECSKEHNFNAITKTILLNQSSTDQARDEIRKYFIDTFDIHTTLYDNINKQHLWYRAEPLRQPVIWYAAHSAVFYINKLRVSSIIETGIDGHYESTFAVGVDEMSWDDKLEDRDDWPDPHDILLYRNKTRCLVLDIINTCALTLPIKWESPFWVILMGIEHERIHIETSSVIIRQFPIHMLKPSGIWNNECKTGVFNKSLHYVPNLGKRGHSPSNKLLPVPGKIVKYGRNVNDMNTLLPVYGWDNEFGEQEVDVPAFNATKYLVSNEEYYEFVLDNGYKIKEYWSDEGWKWLQSTKSEYPKFWKKKNDGFYLRNMLTIIPMAWNWPVITNHLESGAFCNWKSIKLNKNIRLLSEDEWHVLRQIDLDTDGEFSPYWEHNANINLQFFTSESPIDMFEFNNVSGFYDIIGNVWQHTITPAHPFKGFQVHPFYDDFTVPCFGVHHSIIKGGSWISTGNEATYTSRYQFRRHFYQHAGIRYVQSNRDIKYLNDIIKDNSKYNDQEIIDSFTHFHYWNEKMFNINNYPKQIALNSIETFLVYGNNTKLFTKALDLGCGVGRTSFELAKKFDYVIGIDITARLISVAYHMQELGQLEWEVTNEGDIKDHYSVTAKELGINKVLNKVFFVQNDALNLDTQYTNFDLIVISNIIDRINDPYKLLNEVVPLRLVEGGILVLCDPYSWAEQFTKKGKWLGGYYKNNDKQEPIYSRETIKLILGNDFDLKNVYDIPMIIRETKRKHEHILTECIVFQKKINQ